MEGGEGFVLEGVREYAEGYPVCIRRREEDGRWVVEALNEGGLNGVEIDLLDLVDGLEKWTFKMIGECHGVDSNTNVGE